jgi:hypothetical protein
VERKQRKEVVRDRQRCSQRQLALAGLGNGGGELLQRWVEEAVVSPTLPPSTLLPTTPHLPLVPTVTGARWGGCIQPPAAALPLSIHGSRKSARCAVEHIVEGLQPPVGSPLLAQIAIASNSASSTIWKTLHILRM